MIERLQADALRDQWGGLAAAWLERVRADLGDPDPRRIRDRVKDLHAADLA